jgi:hypothetical protein
MYSLTRLEPQDGAGDCGSMCNQLRYNEATEGVEAIADGSPTVGWCMQVGSPYARTMVAQDWWQCSYITEIVSENENDDRIEVVFLTGNSKYLWTKAL